MVAKWKNNMDFELYYLIPWPQCQELQEDAPRNVWSFTDPDTVAGIFVEKEWFDENRKDYGL